MLGKQTQKVAKIISVPIPNCQKGKEKVKELAKGDHYGNRKVLREYSKHIQLKLTWETLSLILPQTSCIRNTKGLPKVRENAYCE